MATIVFELGKVRRISQQANISIQIERLRTRTEKHRETGEQISLANLIMV